MTCDLSDSHAFKAEYRHDQMLTSAFISMVHCVVNQFVALSSTESCQTYQLKDCQQIRGLTIEEKHKAQRESVCRVNLTGHDCTIYWGSNIPVA